MKSVYYEGRVLSVRFANEDESFFVLKMQLDEGGDPVIAKGHVPGLQVGAGTWFGFEGTWETHPVYGRQIAMTRAPVLRGPWSTELALKMLQSHGVGPRVCKGLQEHFGDHLVSVLGDEARLTEVAGINSFTAQYIVRRWTTVRALYQSLGFLGELGLPTSKVEAIYAQFGDEAERLLSDNPWALVQVGGIRFEQADHVARKLGLKNKDDDRLHGLLLHACKASRGLGHLYVSTGDIVPAVREQAPTTSKSALAGMLRRLHTEKLLVIDTKTCPGVTALYEPWFHVLETEAARMLAERVERARIDGEELDEYRRKLGTVGVRTTACAREGGSLTEVARTAIEEFSEHGGLRLSDHQLHGAVNALVEPVSIVTGLPGTGKTTLLRMVVKVLQDAAIPFVLVAPTGIAAKRITALTGAEASTIHRAFGARGAELDDGREATYAGIVGDASDFSDGDGSSEVWSYGPGRPHPAQVLVCDESSMVDQHLLYRILTCTSPSCRLVFVGDAAQLPSVGPGNVLRDLIESERFGVVRLHEIYRQEEASGIIMAAHAINDGRVPNQTEGTADFRFVEVDGEQRVLDCLLNAVEELYRRRLNFQVLSPRHAGLLGVTNLNLRIRELLNPRNAGVREIRLGKEMVREGDRIMVSKNDYKYEIFNGDVGKIVRVDADAKIVEIKIHGPPVVKVQLPLKKASALLRLAYAITTHKSQGQEYDVIVMPWVTAFRHQLQRNLLYTAVTRARKKVIMFGQANAMARAVANSREDTRNTLFRQRLQDSIGA